MINQVPVTHARGGHVFHQKRLAGVRVKRSALYADVWRVMCERELTVTTLLAAVMRTDCLGRIPFPSTTHQTPGYLLDLELMWMWSTAEPRNLAKH